jgi:hypothetical protein
MRLDLEFHEASSVTNVTAYVVVNDFDPSPDGLPCLAEDCVSMAELVLLSQKVARFSVSG